MSAAKRYRDTESFLDGREVVLASDFDSLLAVLRRCVELLETAHGAPYSEYVSCPWCAGHIGYENMYHIDGCEYPTALAAARAVLEEEK